MIELRKHSIKLFVALSVIASCLFCILFGQGTHFHDLTFHFSDHFDVHAQVHAHESHKKEPFQSDFDHNRHQHEVNTSSEIIGTLTAPLQIKPDVKIHTILSWDASTNSRKEKFGNSPALLDLPPPGPAATLYYFFSFSHRGPPVILEPVKLEESAA